MPGRAHSRCSVDVRLLCGIHRELVGAAHHPRDYRGTCAGQNSPAQDRCHPRDLRMKIKGWKAVSHTERNTAVGTTDAGACQSDPCPRHPPVPPTRPYLLGTVPRDKDLAMAWKFHSRASLPAPTHTVYTVHTHCSITVSIIDTQTLPHSPPLQCHSSAQLQRPT